MFSAWRERSAEKRIEIAHNASQLDPKYVYETGVMKPRYVFRSFRGFDIIVNVKILRLSSVIDVYSFKSYCYQRR